MWAFAFRRAGVIILLLVASASCLFAQDIKNKFRITVGRTSVALIGNPGAILNSYNKYYPTSFSIGKILTHNQVLTVSGYTYSDEGKHYYLDLAKLGTDLRVDFQSVSISYGIALKSGRFMAIPALTLGYRFGNGSEVLTAYKRDSFDNAGNYYPTTFKTAQNRYSSLGVGINTELSFTLFKHLILGVRYHYAYFFEKTRIDNPVFTTNFWGTNASYTYAPNKQVLSVHWLLGVAF